MKKNKFKDELKYKVKNQANKSQDEALEKIHKYNTACFIKKNPDKKDELISIFKSEEELEEYFKMIEEYDSKDDIEK